VRPSRPRAGLTQTVEQLKTTVSETIFANA
jgi:hypothetical protein